MKKAMSISIYFTYRYTNEPWGGANNFLRSLSGALSRSPHFNLLDSPSKDCDVLFMNQLVAGPAQGSRLYCRGEVNKMLGSKTRLVVRTVNLKRHWPGYTLRTALRFWWRDRALMSLLRRADHVIFQSAYQKSFFERYGFRGKRWSIIHNGADPVFSTNRETPLPLDEPLRVVACSIGGRQFKRHDLMAAFSLLEGVQVSYIGHWPEWIPPGRVHLMGKLTAEQIAKYYRNVHYLLHPAYKDVCPNVVCEAMAMGLPVIYNPAPGGAPELVGDKGIRLDESNLEETLQEARVRYTELASLALEQRGYYSINRTFEAYAEIFRKVSALV
jgi:glycosyltransferase involved in cell wall biosynthesis